MQNFATYLRSVIFGINDSLVSTVGLLAGINVAGVPKSTIILTGVVYSLVEGFSMAMGNFLSEESADEYATHTGLIRKATVLSAVFMFISFVGASLIPLLPYILFSDGTRALIASIFLSVVALFVAGAISGILSGLPLVWRGLRMALLGGVAIVVGVAIGFFMPAL
ncbi:MAG TPA: VIT1/CCC1 transporter family protein [Candidatus Paceibacterota bacterium]|nr:VIT1/CCC1 transporter family protein [Candidatus Paceibacterota bacterium]